MSSILKALKKLENEASVKGDIRSNLHQSPAKAPKARAADDPPATMRRFIIFSALILLVASGLILTFKSWHKQPASTKITGNISAIAPLSPVATKMPAIKDSAEYDPSNGAAEDPSLVARKIAQETPDVVVKTTADQPKPSDVFEKYSASEQPINGSQSTGEQEHTSYQMEDNTRSATIPIKSAGESMLELQAIAWSGHPEKRMVVINGHIVHEGDLVEGSVVKHIGKNEVVFLKGDEEWRQLFRSAARF